MKFESIQSPEHKREQEWLNELSHFIVEANKNTWAADKPKLQPQRPGYKELEYSSKDGLWLLRDSYTGYFRAPGMTSVYYKDVPSWVMMYGGHGQTEGFEHLTKGTFDFLKQALMQVMPELPFRGPPEYIENEKYYSFKMLDGDISDGLWREEITENGYLTFSQTGIVGTVIPKTKDTRLPILPWDR